YGTSSVHFDADKEEEINLVLPIKSVEKRSVYLRITSDLRPKIGEGTFKDLQENEDRQNISYLANKTGWENNIPLKSKEDTGHAKAETCFYL
ncbi:MAG: hypothetical protein IMF19_05160, partial [Proteobacteria bacterium]|nr:hypothetical protein [Pseudomonadota bacterium]